MADFHSAEAAGKAAEDWAKQFQKNENPENVDEVSVSTARIGGVKVNIANVVPDSREGGGPQIITSDLSDPEILRVDKLVREAGLAVSTAEAARKIKERAVHINGHIIERPVALVHPAEPLVVRVGKKIKRVVLTLP